jgi:RNA polymerase sigma-70 factor, ECF subfamily
MADPHGDSSPAGDEAATRTLVEAARLGDREAFMTIMERHDRLLRTLVYRMIGDRGEMDDALQDIALKAFVSLSRFRGDAALSTWLYRIAYTTCLDRIRTTGRTVPLDDMGGTASSVDEDPADTVPLRVELAAALASLSPEQRAVVALVLETGLDHRTAAAVLDVPMGTVASRLAAARAVLRTCLREPSDSGGAR